jgi:hypothetical protein
MAIQKELWLPRIEENLFQKYELLSTFASDDSIYANNKTIHLPSAGTTPSITKGNGVYPVAIGERTDQEVTYDLTNYEIGPIRLGWADQLQLSYDKSQSITNDFMGGLGDRVIREMLVSFYHRTAGTYVETTGATATAHSPSATSNRHALTGANVLSAALILDKQQIPMSDRFLLLDATMFYQLLTDMNCTAERVEVNPNGLSILIPPIASSLIPKLVSTERSLGIVYSSNLRYNSRYLLGLSSNTSFNARWKSSTPPSVIAAIASRSFFVSLFSAPLGLPVAVSGVNGIIRFFTFLTPL